MKAERLSWSQFRVVAEVPKLEAQQDETGTIVKARWLHTVKSDGR